jgi:tetratricopeptide (TPR) repeat protein
LLELGMLLFDRRRYQEALPVLEKAGNKLDDHATAQFYLGAVYVRLGQLDKGRQVLEKAVELRPNVQYGEPYIYLAEAALRAERKHALSGEAVESGKAGEPLQHQLSGQQLAGWIDSVSRYGNVEICYRMGKVLLDAGKHEEAARLFNEALASYRQSPGFSRRTARHWAMRTWWALKQMKR